VIRVTVVSARDDSTRDDSGDNDDDSDKWR
jgi:hypothetical protein